MGRGPKPAKSKEAKPSVARTSPKDDGARAHDLEQQLAKARAQQAATAEILRVIDASPTDVQPVFDAVVESAVRLLRGHTSTLARIADGQIALVALTTSDPGADAALRARYPQPLDSDEGYGQTIRSRVPLNVGDAQTDPRLPEAQRASARLRGFRSLAVVPLLRQGEAIGAIGVSRREPGGFTDDEIDLLQTFANQAVIAIENVRLFNETKEALERQTATSEILRIISTSPTDIQPVLDTVAENAARLCEAKDVAIFEEHEGRFHVAAAHGTDHFSGFEGTVVSRDSVTGRAMIDRQLVHVHDISKASEFPISKVYAQRAGHRTVLAMPLLRKGTSIGAIFVRRTKVRPFSDKQIALLQTFADQAVIAIENVRLFTELQEKNGALTHAHGQVSEALEQQTATSEILRVISSSPMDTQPVFDTIAANAARLCVARDAQVLRVEGDVLKLVSAYGSLSMPPVRTISRGHAVGRAVIDRHTIHVRDMAQAVAEFPDTSSPQHGVESLLAVPLLHEDVAVGVIRVSRTQIQPFTEQQIALLQTFANQAVIAIENVRLFKELQTSNRELATALDKQTATSEILRVISQSQTDVQPVFDAILSSAIRLMGASAGTLTRVAGDCVELAAFMSTDRSGEATLRTVFPQPLDSEGMHAKAIRVRAPVNIAAAQTDPQLREIARDIARAVGYQSIVAVPVLRHDVPIGTIAATRREPGGFSDDEIALLQTFADQAVIAIENVRLFTELQEKNQALTAAHAQVTEALEQQTATSEILRVISSSPTDVQPVFDAIAANGARLCDAVNGLVIRFDGELLHLAAQYNVDPERLAAVRQAYPRPPSRGALSGRAILTRDVVHVPDVSKDPEYSLPAATTIGYRSVLAVPMMHEGVPRGTILVARDIVAPFSDTHIALIQTFADQAVIAIENVRLFTELQTSNRELTTALDTQTATSDILRVISRSQTNVQPVFDAIVASAVRLLGAYTGALTQIAGDQIELAALTSTDDAGDAATRARFPQSLQSEGANAQAIRDRAPINIADAQTDPRTPEAGRATARARGYRSQVVVPLLRHDEAVGTITVSRREPGGFTNDEIALLQTFADQAVIAIENARLLTELQERTQELTRSVEQLTALGDVGRAVSSSLDLETVLNTIVARAVQLAGAHSGTIWEYDAAVEEFALRITQNVEDPELRANSNARVRRGEGAVGRLAINQRPVQIPDITDEGAYEGRLRDSLVGAGTRALLAIPLLHEDQLLGGLVISRRTPGEFPSEVVDLLASFATQSALALQNARLFLEIEDKSRQVEAASQHKSEFLANMSHELRTPLNAIIGFSEVLSEKMFGELNEKQEEYSKDIHASGQHLLSLINDILDLSKIEAGRMELELSDFHLPTALDSALTLVRERAGRRSIALHLSVDERLGQIQADERKVRQVVLNLLSNAIKFTPEGGRIEISAVPRDGSVEVAVRDTGVGIAPEDQEAVFEEFRQVGTADKKVEGTGLGLTLCRKFVELHGGRIWVKSQLGVGSTFTFTIPVRRGE